MPNRAIAVPVPRNGRQSPGAQVEIRDAAGALRIADANSTLGYCLYTPEGEIEYLFVNAACRRRGYATLLLSLVEERVQRRLRFKGPFSPLGSRLLAAYERRAGGAMP